MQLNIPTRLSARVSGIVGLVLLAAGVLSAQAPCPPAADFALESAWKAYHSNSIQEAAQRFLLTRRLCPANVDASVGLGLVRLRLGQLAGADSLFLSVLARDSNNSDAWEGHARSAYRMGDTAAAVAAGRRALQLTPGNADLRTLLDRLSPDWNRLQVQARSRASTLQLVARTRGRRFEVSTPQGWQPFYIKGVNLGVALPGKYPAEFPADSGLYAGWLDTLAGMNANTLRVYTILPPSFYRALRAWNLSHPDRVLWLIHGVWTELPPHNDFDNPGWKTEFTSEMRRVVDVVHGSALVPVRRGHADGRYDADVSHWVLGYIIGREWEPFAVKAYDARHRGSKAFAGRYLRVREGPAMDRWMAQQCDWMLGYEADTYNALRPIAYTNWPTLDPLTHPTESTTQEEARWRRRSGRSSHAKKLEYENDAIGLDANLVQATPANPAGWFASYHAYPYYPDFMLLDPTYLKVQSSEGTSSYFGYLRQLVGYHAAIPTVISEYGVPSSRGSAHLHPLGWGHGHHDEREMAAIDARLTREIRESGAAGSILFAWMDEWFKKNWAVIDYEIPPENTRLWHNVMDAEQNYGILGQYAGAPGTTPVLGGDPSLWRKLAVLETALGGSGESGPRRLRAGNDESFMYLVVELPPGPFPWGSEGIQLALDTYRPRVGQHRLPRSGARSEVGFEFLIDLPDVRDGRVLVTPDYNRHASRPDPATGDDQGRFARRPVMTQDRNDGRFDSLFVITNRARFGRDGTFFPARVYDRGRLLYATEAASTLADWYFDEKAGLLEIRIPWDLLNVTDPATRTLLSDPRTDGRFGTVTAGDFHVGVLLYDKGSRPRVVAALPEMKGGTWAIESFIGWRWPGWTEPRSHARLKPVYDSIRILWRAAPAAAPARPERTAP